MPNDDQVPQGFWKALFEFAQQVGAHDPVNQTPSSYEQMSIENRKWLEQAMSAYLNDTDPVRLLKKDVEGMLSLDMQSPSEEDLEKGVAYLENLNDLCTQLDNASDFHKIGGFRILIPLLSSSSPTFRANAAELIGDLAQNHPYCQAKLKEAKILSVLLELLDNDRDNRVKVKALFAISCLIRENDELETEFFKADGLCYLLRALSVEDDRLRMKASFLLSYLLSKNEHYKQKACEIGMVDQLVSMLGQVNDQSREHVTSALLALVENYPNAIQECRREEFGLKDSLKQRIEEISSIPAHEEELNSCERLLELCFEI